MKKRAPEKKNAKARTRRRTDWVAVVRKHKPAMNALTDAERQGLTAKALAIAYGAYRAKRHARRG